MVGSGFRIQRNESSDVIKAQMARWQQIRDKRESDPYIGYDTLEDSVNDCRATSQAEALARMLNHENLFLSGPAGSGKSTVVKIFTEYIEALFNGQIRVAITASTGIAASMLGPDARTIYSVMGPALMNDTFKARPDNGKFYRWNQIRELDSIIIDEVSMLSAGVIDHLDALLKHAKRNKEPFGGVQMIFIGDFLQLPPVPARNPVEGVNYGLAITAKSWGEADIQHLYLDKVHRAVDPKLRSVLKKIAANKMDTSAWNIVNSRLDADLDEEKTYTTLFTMNRNVDSFNDSKLAQNPNEKISIDALVTDDKGLRVDEVAVNTLSSRKVTQEFQKKVKKFMDSNNIPESIDLKVGATVMVTKNIGTGLANGTVGVITNIHDEDENHKVVELKLNNGTHRFVSMTETVEMIDTDGYDFDGKEIKVKIPEFTILHMPLRVAYAITVHKSQGQTLDGVYADLSKCFTPGLGYVALSRVSSMENLVLSGVNADTFKMDDFSIKVSRYVKKKSVAARQQFVENIGLYDVILNTKIGVYTAWSGAMEDKMLEM